jgi:cation diffusion facilitator CzcD-associated flavoprotein CzcO
MEISTHTVVIGASAAGLATAAHLKRANIPFELLEATDEVGTAWRKHYERLHLHTTKRFSHLPFVPFPPEALRYPSRVQVVEYLDAYVQKMGLQPRFGQRVVSVRREGDEWVTRTGSATFRSRNVVFATGYTRQPNRPSWPGMESYAGALMHSSEYRTAKPWAGKRVLVVGIGNSGGEIALDLFEQGAHATISVRSAINAVPRDFLGLPILLWGLVLSVLPLFIGDAISGFVSKLSFGKLEELGLEKLPYGPVRQIREKGRIPLLDLGTLARIRSKEIEVARGIDAFTPNGARFKDGSERAFDAVVLATGYRPALGDLLEASEGVIDAAGAPQRSGVETLPGLYFCGFFVAAGGMFRQISKESALIAAAIAR